MTRIEKYFNDKAIPKNGEWRAMLVSTKDIEFEGRTEILCLGCGRDQYPDNMWRLEYKDGDKWLIHDLHCDDCCEEYFPNADLISVGGLEQ